MPTDVAAQVEALRRSNAEERLRAAEALSSMGEAAGVAACALVDAVADSDERVRECAAGALEELGAPPLTLAEQLGQKLQTAEDDCVYWAATLLGRFGSLASAAVPPLAVVLADEQRGIAVRQRAAWALGKIGPPAREALDVLRLAQQSDDARLARLAKSAIAAIGP